MSDRKTLDKARALFTGATQGDTEVCEMNTDEEQLRELWAKGHKAWAGVPNATEWVEKLRGRTEDTPPVAALPPNADITEARARAAHPERMWPVLHAVEGTAERPPVEQYKPLPIKRQAEYRPLVSMTGSKPYAS